MNQVSFSKKERLNVILPDDTLKLLNRFSAKGQRSNFIDKAVRFYVESIGKRNLKKKLEEGAKQRAKRDLDLTGEWFAFENENS